MQLRGKGDKLARQLTALAIAIKLWGRDKLILGQLRACQRGNMNRMTDARVTARRRLIASAQGSAA